MLNKPRIHIYLTQEEKLIEDNFQYLKPLYGRIKNRILKIHKKSAKKYLRN